MFDLKTASREIRRIARQQGITSGIVEFYNTNIPVSNLQDDDLVAIVSNNKKEITITAGDIRYFQQYGE